MTSRLAYSEEWTMWTRWMERHQSHIALSGLLTLNF